MHLYFLIAAAAAVPVWAAPRLARCVSRAWKNVILIAAYALSAAILCFFAGAREVGVGSDSYWYGAPSFEEAVDSGFVTFYAEGGYSSWAPLMKAYLWIVAQLTHSLFWYLFFIEFAIVVPVFIAARIVLKEYAFLGVLVFAIAFYPMTFNMMRQAVAMGFILLSFVFVQRRSPVKFITCIIVAMLFHESAFLGLVVYPVYLIGAWNKGTMAVKSAVLAVVSAAVVVVIPVLDFLLPASWHFTVYVTGVLSSGGGQRLVVFVALMCATLGILHRCLLKKENPEEGRSAELSGLAFVVFFGAAALSLSLISSYLYRVGFYYLYFSIFLIPMVARRLATRPFRICFGAVSVVELLVFSVCYYQISQAHSVVPYLFSFA